jgi:hypothetical protein
MRVVMDWKRTRASLQTTKDLSKYVSFFYQNHIAAETGKHLRKDIRLYRISPISGTAEPAMSKVHGSDSCLLKTA